MTQVIDLFIETDDLGRKMILQGNVPEIIDELMLLKKGTHEQSVSVPNKEEQELIQDAIDTIKECNFAEWMTEVPRKKDGTFAIGRVTKLLRMESAAYEAEDRFGFAAPELIIRTTDGFQAVLSLEERIEKY